MTINVLLADDHSVVRDGLQYLLEAQPDIKVVGHAADGRAALREIERLLPDVVIMDLAMPQMNGIEVALRVSEKCPATRVVMLSMHSTSEHIYRALQAGALGYVLKESAGAEVVDAVRTAHAGRRYLSRKIASAPIDDYIRGRRAVSPLESLSKRERQILQLVAEGKSNAEAAALLFLSPKSVETYRSRLMKKLGVADLPSLVKFAIQHGLTTLE